MVDEVLKHDEKTKKMVVELLHKVPLSDCTATRRVEALAGECLSNLLSDIKKAEVMSLAIDSSCDRTDIEQLSVFVRFFDGKVFREELLCLLEIQGRTTGEIIFNKLMQFFEKNGLDLSKVVSVVTDGAPSMVGHHRGLISRLAAVNPKLIAFHCIIHKSVLCAKLSGKMKETMDTVMRLVNFIRASSGLQHRLFRALLEEMSAERHDLLLHNDVRWLSKGRVLERVCELQHELCTFLSSLQSQKAETFLRFLNDNTEMAFVHFLCDIMSHLNQLNLQLQGKNHTIADMYEAVEAFRLKLDLFERDLQGRKLHFPYLQQHCEKHQMQEDLLMRDFVMRLAENFKERFQSFNLSSELLLFLRQPFSVPADGQWTAEAKRLVSSLDEASLQLEILEMSKSDLLREQHKEASVSDFWSKVVSQAKFKNSRIIAMFLLSMFPSTYICESSFSIMNIIKNQDRNRLSSVHLDQCLRIATTEYSPNIRGIASAGRCHFSH
ncbi:protein FAM200A-like [Paramisgurnus dabryanus]|uniref:protein FAM200A-like n=1 Tax=Paramisgurnus dabryanus TaxID=90735 RepID=UPI0031F441EE